MKKYPIIIILLVTGAHFEVFSQQNPEDEIRKGNALYKNGQYPEAEEAYRKALSMKSDEQKAQFNLANTLYREQKNEDASKLMDELATSDATVDVKSKSAYNKGVLLSREKRLEESIESYKQALRLNPHDKEARENLQKALMELKKKEPPKKKDEKKENQKKKKEQPRPKMNRKEAEQQLQLLNQKEKEVQERLQKNSNKTGNSLPKDW